MLAPPDFVELFHNLANNIGVIGNDAGFEISFVGTLCPHTGAGKVCTSCVGEIAVNYYGF
jgi:hypothetical protein